MTTTMNIPSRRRVLKAMREAGFANRLEGVTWEVFNGEYIDEPTYVTAPGAMEKVVTWLAGRGFEVSIQEGAVRVLAYSASYKGAGE